jgi:hypothetical protein
MTPLAVLFMIVAVGSVVLLAAWCYYRVLFERREDRAAPQPGDGEADARH